MVKTPCSQGRGHQFKRWLGNWPPTCHRCSHKKKKLCFFFCYGYAQIYSFKILLDCSFKAELMQQLSIHSPSSSHGVSHSETPIALLSLDWRDRRPNSERRHVSSLPFHTHSVPITAQKYTCHFNQVAAPIISSNFALVYIYVVPFTEYMFLYLPKLYPSFMSPTSPFFLFFFFFYILSFFFSWPLCVPCGI